MLPAKLSILTGSTLSPHRSVFLQDAWRVGMVVMCKALHGRRGAWRSGGQRGMRPLGRRPLGCLIKNRTALLALTGQTPARQLPRVLLNVLLAAVTQAEAM